MSTSDYTLIKANGKEIGGMMTTPPEAEGTPPNWGIYITVDDVDATARKAEELGARSSFHQTISRRWADFV